VPRSAPVDGFRLTYDRLTYDRPASDGRAGGPPVVLLHGWPGGRTDFRAVVPLLAGRADVVVPDLRGFGDSDRHPVDPDDAYAAPGQARSVAGLLEELDLGPAVLAGYDIGSRIAQSVAQQHPERVAALVITPPVPGVGRRVLDPDAQREFWYQTFHRLPLAERLLDGSPDALRAYLHHFWDAWSAPGWSPSEPDLDALVARYAEPGAFTASLGWYRAGAGTVARSLGEAPPDAGARIRTPTRVLWPAHDPLFPRAWGDRLGEFFADVTVADLPGSGHFVPLEAPEAFAGAIERALTGTPPG
jgi:pimeloyl-ACP methyl ester carboxylesterase